MRTVQRTYTLFGIAELEDEARQKAYTDCPFTGVVSDEIILQPLMDFMRSPDTRNFKELMRDCLENFFRSCRDDCEYCESEEYFTDESHKNNWEYLIDGTLFIETA